MDYKTSTTLMRTQKNQVFTVRFSKYEEFPAEARVNFVL